MNIKTITLHGDHGETLEIPVYPIAQRENGDDGCVADCVLSGNPAHGMPLDVKILLRTDGSWAHWVTQFKGGDSHYLHVEQPQHGPITEAQRRTVARWWLKLDDSPYGMFPGHSVCEWAFTGLTPDEISARYGSGDKVYLTIPCRDDEQPESDATGYHKGDVAFAGGSL